MKALLIAVSLMFGFAAAGAYAQAPAGAPAGTTGLCKDGSYYSGDSKKGACRGHKGVKEWYGASAAATEPEPKAARAPKASKASADATPAAAPAGATGLCKDGTYYSGESKKGACRGHKGVKEWYGASAAAAPASNAPAPSKSAASTAAAPATAPAGATGLCKDGTYYSGDSKRGACRGHKGVKEWYGAAAAGAGAATAMPAKPAMPPAANPMAPANPAMPANPATPSPARPVPPMSTNPRAGASAPESRAAAPGGGAGKVWVNTESKVYHCQDDRYYGKTKQGEYMSEADALAKGNHASHGKACTQ